MAAQQNDEPNQKQRVFRWAFASASALPAAGSLYLLGRIEANRKVAAGQGWEMAFYWSPLVFLIIEVVLVSGAVAGLVGLMAGPGLRRRLQAAAAGLVCLGSFLALPWR